ncbi:hypothetical protein [Rhodohalobacter barkolensis]|uniref:Uncharacterized protein n=1 Tax=Rhodohalobacter barkolensis TaxID=2053187 RepID=A0A2N0VFG8_9BACT|nr:hypothetical protein [Rhodohalobacter barkolensis]PKD42932.1 hypothetical protein CWD77_12875 [Rhodohalobacter barkolensis]
MSHAYGILARYRIQKPQVETCGYDVDHGHAVWVGKQNRIERTIFPATSTPPIQAFRFCDRFQTYEFIKQNPK